MAVNVTTTLGPLLIGGSVGLILSGILAVQCIIFFKLYPNEMWTRRATVLIIWVMDLMHSSLVITSLFDYFINHFGDTTRINYIPSSIALTVVTTAITTMIVHWYFAHKIYHSSGKNWWITAPIVLLAFLRLFAATVSCGEMIHLHRYDAFTEHYPGWVFTTGLSLSASVDIIITGWLCYFLQKMRRRTSDSPMTRVVNTLTIYTLENGFLTCVTTTASLIAWLTMPYNLVFLGLHFAIGKLYANSLLISLNTRRGLREMRWNSNSNKAMSSGWEQGLQPVLTGDDFTVPYTQTYPYGAVTSYGPATSLNMSSPSSAYRPAFKINPRVLPTQLEIAVERRVDRSSDELSEIIRQENSNNNHGRRFHRPRSPRHPAQHMTSLP
ncbi:hypothetical protein R3P38DRAFT_2906789 [Favolaschia claudopus]|uniref:DUF6534 domain-containing protein n=1 Tax=Favolaschia claudopus TaxID=2862362 RepID=A0AAW0CIC4_9AGAR